MVTHNSLLSQYSLENNNDQYKVKFVKKTMILLAYIIHVAKWYKAHTTMINDPHKYIHGSQYDIIVIYFMLDR